MKKNRKTELFENLVAQEQTHKRFELETEPVDAVAAGEARYQELMTSENAPEWARPAAKPAVAVVDAPKTREDITVRLAQLDAEEKAATDRINKAAEERRAILAQQLEEQAREAQIEAAKAVPGALKETLARVRGFVEPTAAPVAEVDDPIARGKAALDRAMRRMRGEDVPEPDYVPPAQRVPQETTLQAQLKARCAPALEIAAAMQAELVRWNREVGKVFDELYVVGEDDANAEQKLVIDLMRGMPAETELLQKQSLNLVKSILYMVRLTVQSKTAMEQTLDSETRHLTQLVARADLMYGPMISRGDKSAAYYDLERDLQRSLRDLATVTADAVAGLWESATQVQKKLAQIAASRTSVEGVPQPPLEWHNPGAVLEGVEIARAKEKADWNRGNPQIAADAGWTPFATGSSHTENV